MTTVAQQHVTRHLEDRKKGLGIRLGVRTTGCSGMAYVIEFVDKLESGDLVFKCGNVKVVVDLKSNIYLDGTVLDYVTEGLKEGFIFKNPNVDAECGCGESFTVRK